MNLIPLKPNPQSELLNVIDVTLRRLDIWKHSTPLDVNSPFYNGVAKDVLTNSFYKVEVQIKRKLSSLKGKITKKSVEEIDKQIKSLRDEWEKDI